MNNYSGLIIKSHCVKDEKSKDAAINSLKNWEKITLTGEEWMNELELGRTIVLADMEASDTGAYSHAEKLWNSTCFVCCDADNLKGVDFDKNGAEEKPDGVHPWTEVGGLSKLYPTLNSKVYAVAESVSSMAPWKDKPHRRYRLIFKFDKTITDGQHYRQILLALAREFSIIPKTERQPAQPVFGNAREGFNKVHICDNILSLSDYPFVEPTPRTAPSAAAILPSKTLREWLDKWHINYETDTAIADKYFVQCPFTSNHTDSICKTKDAYVFVNEDSRFAFHCSHTSCQSGGRTTWESFKAGLGITNSKPIPKQTASKVAEPEPPRTVPEFPNSDGEMFSGGLQLFYKAYQNVGTIPASYLMPMALAELSVAVGRKACVTPSKKKSERNRLYANTFNAIVGSSFVSGKSNVIDSLLDDLYECDDPTLVMHPSLASAEGLIESLESEDYIEGIFPEGTRMFLHFDEMRSLFINAQRKTTQSIVPILNKLWRCPRQERIATRHNPVVAHYPVVNLFGAMTFSCVGKSVSSGDILNGFINRFMFWTYNWMDTTETTDPEPGHLSGWIGLLKSIREETGFRNFTLAEDVAADYIQKLDNLRRFTYKHQDEMLANANTRQCVNALKIALLFSIATNPAADNTISMSVWRDAWEVSEYLKNVNNYLFADIGANEKSKQEILFLQKLNDLGNSTDRNKLRHKIGGHNMSTDEFNKTIEALIINQEIEIVAGKPQKIIKT